jgi:hypothetical protein
MVNLLRNSFSLFLLLSAISRYFFWKLTIVILEQIWFMKEHSYIFADFDEVTMTSSLYGIGLLIITCEL